MPITKKNPIQISVTEQTNIDESNHTKAGAAQTTNDDEKKSKFHRKKLLCFTMISLAIFLVISTTSIALYFSFYHQPHSNDDLIGEKIIESTSKTTSTLSPNEKVLKVATRERFGVFGNFVGKYKLSKPIKRIFLLTTETSKCFDDNNCVDFIVDRQQEFYPEFDDIKENFIISIDGTLLEGRGFEHEGQAVCERDKMTCYDRKAISISFAINPMMDRNLSESQHFAFCKFVEMNLEKFDDKIFVLVFMSTSLVSFEKLQDCGKWSDRNLRLDFSEKCEKYKLICN